MSTVIDSPAAVHNAPPGERSIDELEAAISNLAKQMNIDCYRMLVLVREFDDRFGWMKWSFKSCAEWLAWRCDIRLATAREKVRTAHALRNLPAVAAAFESGRLSYSKVRALTRVADEHDEDLLLAYALQVTVPALEERCRQIRNVSPESVRDARRAWASRSLTAWRNEARGTLRLTVEIPIEEGELVLRALELAIDAGEVTTEVDPEADGQSKGAEWAAQQADALVAVAKSYLDGGSSEDGSTADRMQVVVHADATALAGGTGLADLPVETVKRLLCDCSLVTVLEDAEGKPLDVGRKQRTVSTSLRRALQARDRGCTFPGCARRRYLEGHHVKHWLHGGETSVGNMTMLCTYHHRLLHEGGFNLVREDGALRFVTADGRTIPRNGYRREDFVDDDVGTDAIGGGETRVGADASRDGFSRFAEPPAWMTASEVREPAAVYRFTAH